MTPLLIICSLRSTAGFSYSKTLRSVPSGGLDWGIDSLCTQPLMFAIDQMIWLSAELDFNAYYISGVIYTFLSKRYRLTCYDVDMLRLFAVTCKASDWREKGTTLMCFPVFVLFLSQQSLLCAITSSPCTTRQQECGTLPTMSSKSQMRPVSSCIIAWGEICPTAGTVIYVHDITWGWSGRTNRGQNLSLSRGLTSDNLAVLP